MVNVDAATGTYLGSFSNIFNGTFWEDIFIVEVSHGSKYVSVLRYPQK